MGSGIVHTDVEVTPPSACVPLTTAQMQQAVDELSCIDPDLAILARRHGPPPLWGKPPGFATLVRMILEQQVSLKAARTIYKRLQGEVGRVSPHTIARCQIGDLRAAGITGGKSSYIIGLAQAVAGHEIDLPGLADLPDDEVRHQLTALRGIGPWTADIYLLMVLRRPDIYPIGDLALAISMQRVKGWRERPDDKRQQQQARRWRPWRAVATRMLWQDYLAIQAGRT